jgi:hypothetical protein
VGDHLPPVIMTSDPGSFARRTIVERKPRIIAQVVETLGTGAESDAMRVRLAALLQEMARGTLTSPLGGPLVHAGGLEPEERAAWEREITPWQGRSWLDVPWYFAEAFFYLKLLAACGWFRRPDPGPDPFAPMKQRELHGPGGGVEAASRLLHAVQGLPAPEILAAALMASLWGNRVDLSNFEIDEERRRTLSAHAHDDLVVDHAESVLQALGAAAEVHVILDNAGPELVSDLLLSGLLVHRGARVVLHAKRMPFFVSDATAADVRATVGALESAADPAVAAAGRALGGSLGAGRLRVLDHWFWSSALHFPAMPADVRALLAPADLVLVKGDANYRRLLSDLKWESSCSMDEIAAYFPRPFAALRTLKAEIVVDVPAAKAAELAAADPDWLINGRRGIVRLCRGPGRAVLHPRPHPAP